MELFNKTKNFTPHCIIELNTKFIRTFPNIFRKIPKMSEAYLRLQNISEQSSKIVLIT